MESNCGGFALGEVAWSFILSGDPLIVRSLTLIFFFGQVTEEQPPVAGTDSVRTPTRELAPPRADRESSTLLTDLESISVSLTTIAILLIAALCYLRNAAGPISKNPSLIVAFSFASASTVSAIVVVFFFAFVQFFCTSRGKLSLSWPKYVLLFSVMSLAIAAVALISSMPKPTITCSSCSCRH